MENVCLRFNTETRGVSWPEKEYFAWIFRLLGDLQDRRGRRSDGQAFTSGARIDNGLNFRRRKGAVVEAHFVELTIEVAQSLGLADRQRGDGVGNDGAVSGGCSGNTINPCRENRSLSGDRKVIPAVGFWSERSARQPQARTAGHILAVDVEGQRPVALGEEPLVAIQSARIVVAD